MFLILQMVYDSVKFICEQYTIVKHIVHSQHYHKSVLSQLLIE